MRIDQKMWFQETQVLDQITRIEIKSSPIPQMIAIIFWKGNGVYSIQGIFWNSFFNVHPLMEDE